jgi:hypothetical protein
MKAQFSFEDVDNMECTLKVTMRLKEWQSLKEQLSASPSPSWKFKAAIVDMIGNAMKEWQTLARDTDT